MSKPSIKATVERITPEMATEILLGNTHNRDYSKALCMRYLREMCDGRWQLNGEPIIIADSGKLLDGQHRLNALEQYGKPLDFLVVRGVQEEAFSTIDTGSARKGKDVLSIQKVHNPIVASAICKIVLQYQSQNGVNGSKITFSNNELLAFYNENALLIDRASALASRMGLKRRLCCTAVGLLSVICTDLHDLVETFFLALETGANLETGSPVLTLRNRLEREREGLGALRIEHKIALVFKAWNAWALEREMPKISYAPEKEKFPSPITTLRQLNKLRGGQE